MSIKLAEQEKDNIFKNYKRKIDFKIDSKKEITSEDINNLVIFLNWCFIHRNNFFVVDFNKKSVFSICELYNQLKTNILNENTPDLLFNIAPEKLKSLKFILQNYIVNYDNYVTDTYNTRLCQTVTKNSVKSCITFINEYLN